MMRVGNNESRVAFSRRRVRECGMGDGVSQGERARAQTSYIITPTPCIPPGTRYVKFDSKIRFLPSYRSVRPWQGRLFGLTAGRRVHALLNSQNSTPGLASLEPG